MARTRNNPTGRPPYRPPTRRSTRRTVAGDASSAAPVATSAGPSMRYPAPLSPNPIAFAPPTGRSSTIGAGQSSTMRVDYDEYHAIVTPVSITQTPPLFTIVFIPSTIIHTTTTTTIGAGPSTLRPPAAVTLPQPISKPLFLALTVPPSITPTPSPIPPPSNPTPTQPPLFPFPQHHSAHPPYTTSTLTLVIP
ncbi:proline-rich receptor-like protein kinase PERK2 [Cynara cardunculus var. scolymus]|uniref:proline-rich receptor-like protein kinase PERK2 n=1 Tax=Cynara cardunculus var. scolymus TaxID=59895 RepID=UPI000D62E75D|nr:proline-rich receptor-like protein kinase PERK2 [Cynara cardunculus var. scolymus]